MEAIIEKIRKLLALSENNTSVNEAATAAAMAQALMLENKLSSADIKDESEKEGIIESTFLELGDRLITWRGQLMYALCQNNFCSVFSSSILTPTGLQKCYKIIGRKSDTDGVQYLFLYLVNEINRLADEYGGRLDFKPGKSWFNSFRIGAVDVIRQRMTQQRKDTEDTFRASASLGNAQASTALMVINRSDDEVKKYKEAHYPNLRKTYSKGPTSNDGYGAGKRAGASINLGRSEGQLGAEPKRIGGGS